jgi:Trk-type K+ transport system membrane component
LNYKKKISYFLFKNEELILKCLRILTLVSSILVFGVMVYRFGFNHTAENIKLIILTTRFFYLVFIIGFSIRLALAKDKQSFLSSSALEGILVLLIIYDGVSYFLFGHPILEKLLIRLGIVNYRSIYHFFIQFFLLIFAAIELVKSINSIYTSKLKPTTLFIYSFVLLILGGGTLLTLPGFNHTGKFLNFVDAVFTAGSASCVTGLTVVNTATFFNIKGQIIILLLIQLGGIGILTFASFFASFIKKGIGVKHQIAMNELLDAENISGSYYLIKRILVMTFLIEGLGALGIYVLWGDYQFSSPGEKIYTSIFHSVSAFCNAGFSTFEYNFETPLISELYMLHIFVGVIIFFGSLGFPVIRDVFSPLMLRIRLKEPWREWRLSSKVSIYMSIALILVGMASFYFLLDDPRFPKQSPIAQIAICFFQSVNLRTSGFNSINLEHLPNTLLLLSMFLMFIGASSASTGGGIKTSTFVVMMVAVIGTIRGKREMTLGNRSIAQDLIYKAFAVVIFSGLFVLLVITVLSFTDKGIELVRLAYEAVSAFATVGLSTGITASLTDASKITLTIAMFVGRVGIVTLAYSLSEKAINADFKYATTHMNIG